MTIDITTITSSVIVAAITSVSIIAMMFGRYREKVDRHEGALKRLDELSDRISRLEGGIERDRAVSEYVRRKSPLSLTEKGKALLLDSKGKDYIDANIDSLIKDINDVSPKTPYDVQELAKKILEQRSNDDSFNQIKEFAYKQGFELNLIIEVMRIYLRDKALTKLEFNM